MVLEFFLFAFYFTLCILVLYLISRKSSSFALTFRQAALVFSVKVLVGCLYGYFFLHFYNGDDTWAYHLEGLKEYQILKSDPITFIKQDVFQNGYHSNQFLTIFDSENSFSKDLQLTLLIKLLAVFDLFSQGQYYVNVIFYNVFVFWGSYYLFAALSARYSEKSYLWFLFIFFFPPLLFWSSGIRKDGLSFALLCGFFYQLGTLSYSVHRARQYIFAIIIWIALFLTRSFIAMALIPATIAWLATGKKSKNVFKTYVATSLISVALFFATSFLPQSFNLPLKVAQRQEAFINLTGSSYLPIDQLSGNFTSYIKVLPQALDHIFIRPYPWEADNLLYFFSFIEIVFFACVVMLALIKPSYQRKAYLNDPLMLSMLMVALVNYVLIGYTVPFMGAFIRYRSIFEIFFLIVAINFTRFDFSFLQNIVRINETRLSCLKGVTR